MQIGVICSGSRLFLSVSALCLHTAGVTEASRVGWGGVGQGRSGPASGGGGGGLLSLSDARALGSSGRLFPVSTHLLALYIRPPGHCQEEASCLSSPMAAQEPQPGPGISFP